MSRFVKAAFALTLLAGGADAATREIRLRYETTPQPDGSEVLRIDVTAQLARAGVHDRVAQRCGGLLGGGFSLRFEPTAREGETLRYRELHCRGFERAAVSIRCRLEEHEDWSPDGRTPIALEGLTAYQARWLLRLVALDRPVADEHAMLESLVREPDGALLARYDRCHCGSTVRYTPDDGRPDASTMTEEGRCI